MNKENIKILFDIFENIPIKIIKSFDDITFIMEKGSNFGYILLHNSKLSKNLINKQIITRSNKV
jgi:hypothetical protein